MPDLLEAGLPAPARGVFTTRAGGASTGRYAGCNLALHTGDDPVAVTANRAELAAATGHPPSALAFGRQVHGAGVREVTGPSPGASGPGLPATDALLTRVPGVVVVMLGADCLPVLLAGNGVVGVAHVGREGLRSGVLERLVSAMGGAHTARLGPGICGGCYEVDARLAAEVAAAVPASASRTRCGRPALDLAAGARAQLAALGVPDVAVVGGCTVEQPGRFFSYRRDGVTGRHGGAGWLA